jgi:hypothetical protein
LVICLGDVRNTLSISLVNQILVLPDWSIHRVFSFYLVELSHLGNKMATANPRELDGDENVWRETDMFVNVNGQTLKKTGPSFVELVDFSNMRTLNDTVATAVGNACPASDKGIK